MVRPENIPFPALEANVLKQAGNEEAEVYALCTNAVCPMLDEDIIDMFQMLSYLFCGFEGNEAKVLFDYKHETKVGNMHFYSNGNVMICHNSEVADNSGIGTLNGEKETMYWIQINKTKET